MITWLRRGAFHTIFDLMSTNIVDAEIADLIEAEVVHPADEGDATIDADVVQLHRSWPFRCIDMVSATIRFVFGVASMIGILAVLAAIPIVNLLTYGYLLEVSGRVARTSKFRSGFIGLSSASKIGQIALGTVVCMLPAYLISANWYSAELIASGSDLANQQRNILWVVTILSVLHVGAAWFCGGELKHFFWPLIAPFSLGLWFVRWILGQPTFRLIIGKITNPIAPNLIGDVTNIKPLKEWFLPAVICRALLNGTLLKSAREGIWEFFSILRLHYYFWLGLRGLAGALLWLAIPSTIFLLANLIFGSEIEDGVAILLILPGMLVSGLFFVFLLAVQANFARTNSFKAFVDIKTAFKVLRTTPVLYLLTTLLTFALVIPLFALNIEPIDPQLLWVTCIVFVVLIWPGKMLLGKSLARGLQKPRVSHFMISYPAILLMVGIAGFYSLLLYFTQFIAASGPLSFIENPVFTIPAPYWI